MEVVIPLSCLQSQLPVVGSLGQMLPYFLALAFDFQ